MGDGVCRPGYVALLGAFLAERADQLCPAHRVRHLENPLRVLDCKSAECRAATADAPRFLDHLCDPCAAHFARVRAGLDSLGVGYTIDHRLVRGFDYYTRTTFEFAADALDAAQNGVGGRWPLRRPGRAAGRGPDAGHRVRDRDRAGAARLRRRGRVLDRRPWWRRGRCTPT